MVGAGGPVIGVWIGGPVVEAIGWRAIFAAQVPLTLATVAVCAAIFPVTPRAAKVRFDVAGAVLLALGVGLVVGALNRAPILGWSHALVISGFVVGPLLLVGFVAAERRAASPLIPLRYFRNRNFALPITNQLFANAAYMGGFTVTPFLLQEVLLYSTAKTGFISTARPLTWAVAGPIAGWVTTKVGERTNGVVGGLVLTASMLAFTFVEPGVSELFIIGALMLSGLGMGIMAPAMAAAIANSVDPHDFGVAGAASQMAGQIGIVLGTQIMVTVEQAREGTVGEVAAYGEAYLVGALAAAVATLAAVFVRRTIGGDDAPVEPAEPRPSTSAHHVADRGRHSVMSSTTDDLTR
jgi:MFS family permease